MFDIELQTIHSGYDRKTCWVHARPGAIPGDPPIVVVMMQKLRLTGCDVFYELNEMRTDDGGRTWSEPVAHKKTLGRRLVEGGIEEGISGFTPMWHAKTGVLLGIGLTVRYKDDDLQVHPRPCDTGYSVYDPAARTWSTWRKLEIPDDPKFFSTGACCSQRLDLPNGDILQPVFISLMETAKDVFDTQDMAAVVRCTFDGETLRYVEHGTELTVPGGRGFNETSIAHVAGQYFLTLRNDDAGYITTSQDGLHYDEPRVWTFDDGTDLGNYNTQQHWVAHGDDLYLVYNRRGANNDHVFRHRAPLFIAQVDKDRLCVIRETERILVPERGARLGNFGVTQINEHETWVVVSEWMQTNPPDPLDCRVCEKYGSDNSVFVARIRFDR